LNVWKYLNKTNVVSVCIIRTQLYLLAV